MVSLKPWRHGPCNIPIAALQDYHFSLPGLQGKQYFRKEGGGWRWAAQEALRTHCKVSVPGGIPRRGSGHCLEHDSHPGVSSLCGLWLHAGHPPQSPPWWLQVILTSRVLSIGPICPSCQALNSTATWSTTVHPDTQTHSLLRFCLEVLCMTELSFPGAGLPWLPWSGCETFPTPPQLQWAGISCTLPVKQRLEGG